MEREERLEELLLRWQELRQLGQDVSPQALCADCPELAEALLHKTEAISYWETFLGMRCDTGRPASSPPADCPATLDGDSPEPSETATGNEVARSIPQRIGRYEVEGTLGQGSFGIVYLAHDGQLQRSVAIKVPHPRLVSCPEDADSYLAEARTVAGLDHPNIVPVYDVGCTNDFPCFIVSKRIEGDSWKRMIKEGRPPCRESAELVATIAEALDYAHRKGLVHRDINPGNLLVDAGGQPYICDFGLALKEQDFDTGSQFSGTPPYMSPEQARGEGHRLDGRSDIFSLGSVFYELLAGQRPFHAASRLKLLEQIATVEPRPLRQVDETVPQELERICLKALRKRASERYATARDMADDLRHWLQQQSRGPGEVQAERPIQIVPKGLRSFDAYDADFFLELLPGPRDREGLPDSLRFWKTRIEEPDPDRTFAVGLIYGPSGCGKSSLVKAGLLPRLSPHVTTVYVEATAGDTETRLLGALRKACPGLGLPTDEAVRLRNAAEDRSRMASATGESEPSARLGLIETMAALRQVQAVPGRKVLIVLDQFEQWLHAHREEEDTELVHALRQCDGGRVQCVVLVRDDFWLALSRFMRQLDIRLLEGQNSALVDLFDVDHAARVLAAYGRAFGKLPEKPGDVSAAQEQFLEQTIHGLAQEGKVICVRLALLAEMVKGRPWTPLTLEVVGGTQGIGVTFLEETFSARTAPPEHRYHQPAARAVLQALLPESGTNIKGSMRSHGEPWRT